MSVTEWKTWRVWLTDGGSFYVHGYTLSSALAADSSVSADTILKTRQV